MAFFFNIFGGRRGSSYIYAFTITHSSIEFYLLAHRKICAVGYDGQIRNYCYRTAFQIILLIFKSVGFRFTIIRSVHDDIKFTFVKRAR